MGRIVLLEYVAYPDDVHIKYSHHYRRLACEVELSLNFAGKPAVYAWDRL